MEVSKVDDQTKLNFHDEPALQEKLMVNMYEQSRKSTSNVQDISSNMNQEKSAEDSKEKSAEDSK